MTAAEDVDRIYCIYIGYFNVAHNDRFKIIHILYQYV
jgi:hypothetical protein